MGRKQRLDLQLVELGLATSRQQAQQLIRAGKVRSGDRVRIAIGGIGEMTNPVR